MEIKGLPYEMSVLVAPDGTVYAAKGKEGSVIPPYGNVLADGHDMSKVMDLHNHPSEGKRGIGGTTSDADWEVMFAMKQTESYITAKEGRYIQRITDPSKIASAKAFFSTSTSTGRRKQSNYERHITKTYREGWKKGKYRGEDGPYVAAQHVLQKFGKRYGFEVVFEPNPGYEHLYD